MNTIYILPTEELSQNTAAIAARLLLDFGKAGDAAGAELMVMLADSGEYRQWFAFALTMNDDNHNEVDCLLTHDAVIRSPNDEIVLIAYADLLAMSAIDAGAKAGRAKRVGQPSQWHVEKRGIIPPRRCVVVNEQGIDIAEAKSVKVAKIIAQVPDMIAALDNACAICADVRVYGASVAMGAVSLRAKAAISCQSYD